MRIVVISTGGTIGRAISEELSQRHDVIRVDHIQEDCQMDITSQKSVKALSAQTGKVDAIISTTGNLHFGPLSTMTDRQFNLGLQDKLLRQIHLALIEQHFLRGDGSITLVGGIVAQGPIAQGVNATTVNTDLEDFVRAAACGLPRGIRISLISPTVLSKSLAAYGDFFPGSASVPAAAVVQAYRHSIRGIQTSRICPVGYQPVPARRDRRLHRAVIAGTLTTDCLQPKN